MNLWCIPASRSCVLVVPYHLLNNFAQNKKSFFLHKINFLGGGNLVFRVRTRAKPVSWQTDIVASVHSCISARALTAPGRLPRFQNTRFFQDKLIGSCWNSQNRCSWWVNQCGRLSTRSEHSKQLFCDENINFERFSQISTMGYQYSPGIWSILAGPEGCASGPTTPTTDPTDSNGSAAALFTVQSLRLPCQISILSKF